MRLKRWGVRVTSTADKRCAQRPIKIEPTFTRLGAVVLANRLSAALNDGRQQTGARFHTDAIKLAD